MARTEGEEDVRGGETPPPGREGVCAPQKLLLLTFYMKLCSTRIDNQYEMKKKIDLLQGTLHLLVLQALSPQPLHGLGVAQRISQITKQTFDVKPGSLFPALHRMEEAGRLKSYWGESENNRRAKFYTLTRAGQRQLETEAKDWERIALGIGSALNAN